LPISYTIEGGCRGSKPEEKLKRFSGGGAGCPLVSQVSSCRGSSP
jgi:hypothetical protein